MAAAARRAGLRDRLGWFLLVRLLLVSAFLCGAVMIYRHPRDGGPDLRLGLVALGYGITGISGLLLPKVRRIFLYAAAQITVDLGLVSLMIIVTGALESPLPVLYNLVILNAALLRLGRGITITAAAAALSYVATVAIVTALVPDAADPMRHLFTHTTNVLSFFAIAGLARYLNTQLASAERMVEQQRQELGRIEGLQRQVANTVDHGLIVTDESGRIASLNPSAAEILSLDGSAAVGVKLEALLPGASTAAVDGSPTELELGDGDGRRCLRIKAAPVTDAYQCQVARVYVVEDVTTLRDMESRLREQEQLEAYASSVQPLGDAHITSFEGLVGESEIMRRMFALIEKTAPADSTILITGESGTGKELVARAVHARSPRAKREFVAVNCGAIPETLIESELFGHVRGAFTGAVTDRPGLFRQANGGTIFLDEIGELTPSLQVRLLRVLQDLHIIPVGGSSAIAVDVRVVAATNRDLERLVAAGQFREDLYYRLNVIRIETPPLRTRPEDIPILLMHLLRTCSTRHGKAIAKVSPRTMRLLATYAYPGNIRELENIVDHAVTLCEGDILTEQDLPAYLTSRPEPAEKAAEAQPAEPLAAPLFVEGRSLDDQLANYEKDMLLAALDRAGGVRKRAAEILGIKYRSLRHRLSKYGLALGEDEELENGHGVQL
jgi:transcriptional regulator with PAS, ATPase and Fis domain